MDQGRRFAFFDRVTILLVGGNRMAREKHKGYFLRARANCNAVRFMFACFLLIAYALPLGFADAAHRHDVSQNYPILVAQVDEGLSHHAPFSTAAHCGQQVACSSATLVAHPLMILTRGSSAGATGPGTAVHCLISGPPGHPPKSIVIN